MLKNRLFNILMGLAFVAAVGFTIRTANVSGQLVPSSPDFSDYSLRHPGTAISVNAADLSDYYQRHPELVAVALAAESNASVAFTKWVTSAGVALNSARTAPVQYNMEGVVSGDVGGGKYAGEVLSLTSSAGITKIEALYHINGGTHQFTADVFVTQDDKMGTAIINGVVTDGWLKGAQVQGEYQVIGPCGVINAQTGPFGDLCFQGTLHIPQGLSR